MRWIEAFGLGCALSMSGCATNTSPPPAASSATPSGVEPSADATPTGAAPTADATPNTPVASEPSAPSSGGRMTEEQLAQLAPVTDSSCRAYTMPEAFKVGDCSVVGPYLGELQGETVGPEIETAQAALVACEQDPACMGVTSTWYVGAPWNTVSRAVPFVIDDNSYGCTLLLRCP